ncbi:MAG: hypothetical protein LBV61_02765 [Burkholderiaceae bacterium]|jgi:hypothetical protein|nr:hypothetical protein [Burkholderiaceae bacterium]
MFKHRSDGKYVKNLDPIFKLGPYIMKKRSGAQVFYKEDISVSPMNEYIAQQAEKGIKLSYMAIVYATSIRILSERSKLNRFIVNGITYQRNEIWLSLVAKKGMTADAEETVVKIPFKGTETLFEISKILEDEFTKSKTAGNSNDTDKIARALAVMPHWLIKLTANALMLMDRYGVMPKAIIEASPFHASAFLTNSASIGIDAVYHHLYDFGTVGLFIAMGKRKKSHTYENGTLAEDKCISIAVVGDERICDGLYFANSMKLFKKYMKKPHLLEQGFSKNEQERAVST